MLTRIYVDNFRCFSNFEWRPGRMVLIGGLNGSGKTQIVDVVTAIARHIHGETDLVDEFPAASLTRWEKRTEQRIELDVTCGGRNYRYLLRIDHSWKEDQPRVLEESLMVDSQQLFLFRDGEVRLFRDDGSAGPIFGGDWTGSMLSGVAARKDNTLLSVFKAHLREFWKVGLVPPMMGAESRGRRSSPDTLMDDFVSWYASLSGDGVGVQALQRALESVIDRFEGLKLTESGRNRWLLSVSFAKRSPEGRIEPGSRFTLDFDELSDGQRALIALYALLHFGPLESGLLCLDEPDNYLALSEVEPWLRALEQKLDEGDGQVFLISHHPESINRLWSSHGAWFERLDAGPVRVRAMNAPEGLTPAEMVARGWA